MRGICCFQAVLFAHVPAPCSTPMHGRNCLGILSFLDPWVNLKEVYAFGTPVTNNAFLSFTFSSNACDYGLQSFVSRQDRNQKSKRNKPYAEDHAVHNEREERLTTNEMGAYSRESLIVGLWDRSITISITG